MDEMRRVADRWKRRLPDDPRAAATIVLSRQATRPVRRRFNRCVVVATPDNVAGLRAAAELPPVAAAGYGVMELIVSDDGKSCEPITDLVFELGDIAEVARLVGDGPWAVFGESAFVALERTGAARPDPATIIDLFGHWFQIVRPELAEASSYETAAFAVPARFDEAESALAATARWLGALLGNHLLHCPFGDFSVTDDSVACSDSDLAHTMRLTRSDLTDDDRTNAAQVLNRISRPGTAGG